MKGQPSASVKKPSVCKNFGDLSHYKNLLYVATEKCNGQNRIYVYDTKLKLQKYGVVKSQTDLPWVAVSPITGHIYSSNFSNGGQVRLLYKINLDVGVRRIQGGAFSRNDNLYITSDNKYKTSKAGGYMFQIYGTKGFKKKFIGPKGYSPNNYHKEQIQGITTWIPEGMNTGLEGSIHWILIQKDRGKDDVFFKHISVHPSRNL